MANGKIEGLNKLIKDLEDRLDQYRNLREFAENYPALLDELTDCLLTPQANEKISSHPVGKEPGDISFGLNATSAKIVNFLKQLPPEEFVPMQQISDTTGIKYANIYSLFHNGLQIFVEPKAIGKKSKHWRLKPGYRLAT